MGNPPDSFSSAESGLERGTGGPRRVPHPRLISQDLVPYDWGLPPLPVHSSPDEVMTKLWPLQAFLPLQWFCALLQEPWPLHALAPAHFTLGACACGACAGFPVVVPES